MDATRPAGFWIRAAALAVDFVLFFLVQVSLGFFAARVWGAEVERAGTFLPSVWAFTFLFSALYTTALHSLAGQTLGKLLVGIRVVGLDGADVPVGTAFLRYLGYFISLGTLGFGFAMAGLRPDKRALHDLIAGTRVERLAPRIAPRPTAPVES